MGEKETELLDRHCSQLAEHFDTVQIFVTRHNSGTGTESVNWGTGNWYARFGQVQAWIEKRSEETRIEVRNDNEE